MGRAKPKPPEKELPNRLAVEKPKRNKQLELADGDGKPWGQERIPEIENPAEEYRLAKKERKASNEKLKEAEVTKYDALKTAMDLNKKKLGPKQVYRYEDSDGDRQEVRRSEPKVTIKKIKPPKESAESDEGNGINPDGGEPAELE